MEPQDARRDAELVERFLRGEPEALAEVDAWIARAASPFRWHLGHDWEDVLQEIRLEAVRLLQEGRFRGESRLRTYLWSVAGHRCVDALRRRRRTAVELGEVPEPASPEPSPLDHALEREGGAALVRVLEAMPRDCRDLWRLILRGLSYREISRRLGVPEGTLRVRAHRCRNAALEACRGATVPRETKGAVL